MTNPFIAFYQDPISILSIIAYTIFLLALATATLTVISVFLDRGWRHLIWLSEAYDHRNNNVQYGEQWEWYLPTKEVSSHVWRLGAYVTAILVLVAVDVWAIGAVVYILS